jgi:TPP-dependent pyruvate/acetoin dehydrogenase alpha subunit
MDKDTYERFYRSLYRIRHVEEEIARIYPSDKIKSPVHLSIGQEAISVGACEALRPDDEVFAQAMPIIWPRRRSQENDR